MPLEKGGRADKIGNRYEIQCIVYEFLNLLSEKNYSVVVEALGEDEQGTDILVTYFDGVKEYQQCKARNASKEYWDFFDLKWRNILKNWKYQLVRDENSHVALVSPIGCSFLVDLHNRALNTDGKPRDFYEFQIKRSSKEFCKFYEDFCAEMSLNCAEDNDIIKSIEYIKRIHMKSMSEYERKESIYQKIEFLFRTNKEVVYNALVTFVIDGDILGREITLSVLMTFLQSQQIEMRSLNGDKRIIPQIKKINQEYRDSFKKLKEGLIQRQEFEFCIEAIKSEQNLIISGSAGYGKSGCTEAILDYCDREQIPYIAIKLDRKIPQKSCEIWGHELGFPSSISYALHSVSRNQQAVIVLDQLDALRWTQTNSSEALMVCMELIRQVNGLNKDRQRKMNIVFVCRAYDLQNDNNIKALFKTESDLKQDGEEWKRVVIQDFDTEVVKKVVGDKFEKLSPKTRRLLQIPSNLYIWQHLDDDETYDDCVTTSHLIAKWYQQICRKSMLVGVTETVVRKTQEQIVAVLDGIGRLYVPKIVLNVEETGFDYLIWSDMIVIEGNRVGFVHQSILDYFISNRMMQQYFNNIGIEEIIGERSKQTPNKRYQIQMFLQNILEFDSSMFVVAGKEILKSDNIRCYVKSVFYEILGQISRPDETIKAFIAEECKGVNVDYFLNNVVYGKSEYVAALREKGVLEKWFDDENRKTTVFSLLRSIRPDFSSSDIQFIKERAFKNEEDDKKFSGCFFLDIMKESDEVFELRMLFYNKYPEWANEIYIDMKAMMENCEKRTIRLISFWLRNKIKSKGRNVYKYEEELVDENDSFLVDNGSYVLDELLQYIPQDDSWEVKYGDWSARYMHTRGLERATIGLVKKANKAIIKRDPERFWKYYEPYMGKGYLLYNEIILHALQFLPKSFSNRIVSYLSSDLDNKIFDFTSGSENQLELAMDVIKVHASLCDDEYLLAFESVIIRYISPKAVEWYKYRIEQNKSKGYAPVYWSFWGELQYLLLQSIPGERLSENTRSLLKVLEKRFDGKTYHYSSIDGHSGWVSSPVSGKKIGKKQWLQIITNQKLKERRISQWKEVEGGFIESSLELFASDFSSIVKEEPETMIQMVLEHKDTVIPAYIDSMYSGAEFSDHIDEVNQQTWEEMFSVFPCDMESQRASYFCGILEKTKNYRWSAEVLLKLKEIALNYKGLVDKVELEEDTILDSEKLYSKTLNCVRGNAVRAIGHLLWENKDLFMEFKSVIEKLVKEDEPAIRMASLYALRPSYNIDREWAEIKIIELYESDVRMAAFQDSKGMFFCLYSRYAERVLEIIRRCFESEDKTIIRIGGYALCEFYIRYGEFEEYISRLAELGEEQVKAILHMAVIYLEFPEYRDKSKAIILKYKNEESDVEFPLGGMFSDKLVDVQRDLDFLLEIMKSKVSKRMVFSFVRFLEENAGSIKDYSEIILALCENVLGMDSQELSDQWGIEDDISKLIIALYDECSNSERKSDQDISEKCLELWDIMFEKHIGRVRELSRKLMER